MAKKVSLDKLEPRLITVRLIGISPLIIHAWSEKAKEMMRQKHQEGRKTRDRDLRNPEEEGKNACYWVDADKRTKPGVLAISLKCAVIEAAHNDFGIPKTLVRKALFVYPMGRDCVIPLEPASGKGKLNWQIEEDLVRVGQGKADLRYRPYFYDWSLTTQWELYTNYLLVPDFLKLLDWAGLGVGIHEWRPQLGGEFGRFRIDQDFKVKDEPIPRRKVA